MGITLYEGAQEGIVPPSGGSLEIGNSDGICNKAVPQESSPFGGIPRNWKQEIRLLLQNLVALVCCSPFGGIPRNWKLAIVELPGDYPASLFPLRGDP